MVRTDNYIKYVHTNRAFRRLSFECCRRSGEIFRSMEIHCVPENVYAALVSSHYFKEKRGMEYGRTDIAHFK